jgi:hypothetical protein
VTALELLRAARIRAAAGRDGMADLVPQVAAQFVRAALESIEVAV